MSNTTAVGIAEKCACCGINLRANKRSIKNMGSRGPKPKSAVLKLLEGNPGRRPVVETINPSGSARMPSHLSDEAKKAWKRIISSMPDNFYKLADSEILAAYCEAYSQHKQATERLKGEDVEEWEDLRGKPHPARAVQQASSRLIATLGTRLNLSPGDRACSGTQKELSKWSGLIG